MYTLNLHNVYVSYISILKCGLFIKWNIIQEGNSVTCYNMDEPWRHYVKWTKPDRKGQILYGSTYMKYLE